MTTPITQENLCPALDDIIKANMKAQWENQFSTGINSVTEYWETNLFTKLPQRLPTLHMMGIAAKARYLWCLMQLISTNGQSVTTKNQDSQGITVLPFHPLTRKDKEK